jgi:outer membrane receptor protein involved in Fe transport
MHIRNGLLTATFLAIGLIVGYPACAEPQTNPSTKESTPTALPLPPPMPELPTTQPQASPSTNAPPPIPPAAVHTFIPPTTAPAATSISGLAPQTTGKLPTVVVTSNLDQARNQISPSLGADAYTLGPAQIQAIPEGQNTPFQQVLLRMPSVVMDSFGQEHVRGEHANLTYDINGVLLPEAINTFGQELDTRVIQSVTLIDGALPAQYGFHTAGIIDVTTKSGATLPYNEVSIYGGGYDTYESAVQLGGVSGKLDYYFMGDYKHDDIGIENPTPSYRPIHDDTSQERGFLYLAYHIDDTSRVSLLLNGSYQDFQLPNTPGVPPAFTLAGVPNADSQLLNETQNEQDYYGVISYQKSADDLNLQASYFTRFGQIHFVPDTPNDLIFQGVASDVLNGTTTNGAQFDASYNLSRQHTLRAGFILEYESENLDTSTSVFPVDSTGAQTSDVPFDVTDDSGNTALSTGVYLQDEWKLTDKLTLNYGGRFDDFDANFDKENQFSPRVNLVWKADDLTTFHGGYARYFVTPPPQNTPPSTIDRFAGTSNAPQVFDDAPPVVERSDYFDIGVSRQLAKGWKVDGDAFYKMSRNLIDEGQFGTPVIFSPFNYRIGHVDGAEISTTYDQNGFSAFGNFAWVQTSATGISSQQFLFTADELAWIDSHNVHLDHESEYTASAGVSYAWRNDRVYLDLLYGSGLRSGFANLDVEPQYYPVNIGWEHIFRPGDIDRGVVRLRADVINLFDESYQIRSGTGIGVSAPQYGQRRALMFGLAYDF